MGRGGRAIGVMGMHIVEGKERDGKRKWGRRGWEGRVDKERGDTS